MTHIACETKLLSVVQCPGNCVAIGPAVVKYARALVQELNAGTVHVHVASQTLF